MRVGVLALQGGFELHQIRLSELDCESERVSNSNDLSRVDALILPGGESSTLLKLCGNDFRQAICRRAEGGMPMLATCAGLILIARHVSSPEQESLGLLEVDVKRNAYGRQRESFISKDMRWTEPGKRALQSCGRTPEALEGVFIRAPQITAVGEKVEILLTLEKDGFGRDPVFVRQGNRFGASFHPELSPNAKLIHQLFLASIRL